VQLLLQCDGLTWFDLMAEKPLSDLGSVQFTCIYSVQVSSFNIRAHGFLSLDYIEFQLSLIL
jgi:hypothetical protein